MVHEIHRGWGGSCRGEVGHAEVEWVKSYKGGMDHAVKQPKKNVSPQNQDLTPTKIIFERGTKSEF